MQTSELNLAEVCVRPLKEKDLPGLEWEGEFLHFRNLYRRSFQDYQKGLRLMMVAEYQERIIGQVFILFGTIQSDPEPDRVTAYLYSLRVRPELRRRGVGRLLIVEAEERIRRKGFRRVLIAVARTNEGALRLYERLGYTRLTDDPGRWSYTDHLGRLQHVDEPSFILEKRLD